jgi:hypothetical protein
MPCSKRTLRRLVIQNQGQAFGENAVRYPLLIQIIAAASHGKTVGR